MHTTAILLAIVFTQQLWGKNHHNKMQLSNRPPFHQSHKSQNFIKLSTAKRIQLREGIIYPTVPREVTMKDKL